MICNNWYIKENGKGFFHFVMVDVGLEQVGWIFGVKIQKIWIVQITNFGTEDWAKSLYNPLAISSRH